MSRRNPSGAFWPRDRQRRLLEVALGGGDVVTAWEAIRPEHSLDEFGPGSFELLPLVYRRVAQVLPDDPMLPTLRGVYRRTWVKNNVLVKHARDLSHSLVEGAIQALFVEGPILASRLYADLGLRPTSSVDVLVKPDDVRRASARFARTGWRLRTEWTSPDGEVLYFTGDDRTVVVLRARIAPDFQVPRRADSALVSLFDAAEQHLLEDVAVPVPAATDALLMVCVAHARKEGAPNLQWLADAKMLLEQEVNWQRFHELAVEGGQALRLLYVLRYLAALPGPKPPAEAVLRLQDVDVSARERAIYTLTAHSLRSAGSLPPVLAQHLAKTAHESWPRTLAGISPLLRARWKLERRRQLPRAVWDRLVRRSRRRRGQRNASASSRGS